MRLGKILKDNIGRWKRNESSLELMKKKIKMKVILKVI